MENNEIEIYNQLLIEVRKYGYKIHDYNELMHYPIKNKDSWLIKRLTEYLTLFREYNNKDYIIRCLTKKGLYSVTALLIRN